MNLPFDQLPLIGGVSEGVYVTPSASLNIKIRNFVSGLNLNVKAFFLKKNGEVQPFKLDNLVPTSDGAENVFTFPCLDGLLLCGDISLQSTSLVVREGDCFVDVGLQLERANISNSALVVALASGYVSNTKSISFPSAGIQGMTDEIGKSVIIEVSRPAANNQWTYTIPDHRRFRLMAISFELVTDANAANRNILVQITPNGSSNGLIYFSNTNLTASLNAFYSWSNSGRAETQLTIGTNSFIVVPFPQGIELHAGDIISSLASGFQVGDRYNRIELYGKLWIDPGTSAGNPGGGGGAS